MTSTLVFGLFVQGSAPPAIEEYAVWGLNPTGGGIKSREEQPGGECRSAAEGPKVPEGFGDTPQNRMRQSSTPELDSISTQERPPTTFLKSPFFLGSSKVSKKTVRESKITIFEISSQNRHFRLKKQSNFPVKKAFSKSHRVSWVSIGR